jgi:alkylation response protein AidB-like acyl-CoA dehydrogenase
MDFGLTEEQTMFRDSVARFLGAEYGFETRQKLVAGGNGFPDNHWSQYAQLGWLAAPFPEDCGGLGGGAVEVALVMEQMGRALCPSPYLATIAAGICIHRGGSAKQREELLAKIADGGLRLAVAHDEVRARHARAHVETSARPEDGGFVLSGAKCAVPFAEDADLLLVSARSSGALADRSGVSLFLVPRDTNGISLSPYATQDGGRAADVSLAGVRVAADDLIGTQGGAYDVIDLAYDWSAAMICAEAVGAMWEIHTRTLDYLKTREQFGQKLSTFQALQHRMVDMYMRCELAQSVAMDAVAVLERDDVTERRLAVSAAKIQVGRLGRLVGQEGIQLHGGIGMSNDVPIGHYFKRLTMGGLSFGDVDWHLSRFAAVGAHELHNHPPPG